MTYDNFVVKKNIIYHKNFTKNKKYTIRLFIENNNFKYTLAGNILYDGGEMVCFNRLLLNNSKNEYDLFDCITIINKDNIENITIQLTDNIKIEKLYQFIKKSSNIQCEFYFFGDMYAGSTYELDRSEIKGIKETIEKYYELI